MTSAQPNPNTDQILERLGVAHYDVKMTFKILFTAPLIIAVLFLVFSYFFSLPLGSALFLFTPEGSAYSTPYHRLGLPIELFTVWREYIPVTATFGSIFLFLLAVYAVCFAGAWLSRESLQNVVRKGLSRPFTKLFNNNLFAMPIIASMLLTAFIVIHSFQEAQGIPTGSLPETDPFELFLLLAYSPVIEEISFRISTIGVFLIVYLLWMGRDRVATWSGGLALKVALLIPFYPDKAKKLLGVKTVSEFGIRGISPAEWIMIIITALAFGLTHYFAGIGWEIGKITTATLDGFAWGLAYLLYGAQAPILLHWFVNYYLYSYSLALDFYPAIFPIVFLIDIATLILGVVGWSMFTVLLGARLYRRRKRVVTPPDVPPSLPTPPPPTIRFCRHCGRVLSEDMRFCPYCGKALEEERKEEA